MLHYAHKFVDFQTIVLDRGMKSTHYYNWVILFGDHNVSVAIVFR